MKPKMTVGLAFDSLRRNVLMQLKNRPEHCAGRLNGPGGKQEVGESIVGCMVREFYEETSIKSTKEDWLYFHHERHPSGTDLYFYTTDKLNIYNAASKTDEPSVIVSLAGINGFITPLEAYMRRPLEWERVSLRVDTEYLGLMYNMTYLLPMALVYLNHPEHRYLEG